MTVVIRDVLLENVSDRHRPAKSWGWEEWIVNNDLYCGKRLHFTKLDGSTSLHFHAKKHETMYVERGEFLVTIIDTNLAEERRIKLQPGHSLVIPPNTVHRISALFLDDGEAVMVEFSTHHEDSDSYRIAR